MHVCHKHTYLYLNAVALSHSSRKYVVRMLSRIVFIFINVFSELEIMICLKEYTFIEEARQY